MKREENMMVQYRKNLRHCHPEILESHFQPHQYFGITFNLSLIFSQTLLFFWTLGKHIFALQIVVFQDLDGIIRTLNLVSISKLFITKPPHVKFIFKSPSRSWKFKISMFYLTFCHPKYCKGKNKKYFNTLLWKCSDMMVLFVIVQYFKCESLFFQFILSGIITFLFGSTHHKVS